MNCAPYIVLFAMFITAVSGITNRAIAGEKTIYSSLGPATHKHMVDQISPHRSLKKNVHAAESYLLSSVGEDRHSSRGKKYKIARRGFVDDLIEAPDRPAPPILSEFGLPNMNGVPPIVLLFPPKQETVEIGYY